MRSYKRVRITGGAYFFTVSLAERHGNDLLTQRGVYPVDWAASSQIMEYQWE
jgi:hypothetical protein